MIPSGETLVTCLRSICRSPIPVYPDGNPAHALNGVSTYEIAPGQGVVFDITLG